MIHQFPIVFTHGTTPLAGCFYRNTVQLEQRQPAIVITGSWLTVKEQMAHDYAGRLAALGYTVFTFDFAGFGQSGGELRQTEIPARKIGDIVAAVDFVRTMSFCSPARSVTWEFVRARNTCWPRWPPARASIRS